MGERAKLTPGRILNFQPREYQEDQTVYPAMVAYVDDYGLATVHVFGRYNMYVVSNVQVGEPGESGKISWPDIHPNIPKS